MKKILPALLALCLLLAGCGKTAEPQTGAYFLEGSDINSAENMAAFLTLNSEQKSFIFLYDAMAYGSYTVKNGVLTASSQDGQHVYRFDVQDESTLALQTGDGELIFRLAETEDAGSESTDGGS